MCIIQFRYFQVEATPAVFFAKNCTLMSDTISRIFLTNQYRLAKNRYI
jgi:hypothetical protein